MHRWVWGLHYPPPTSTRHEYPISAIPHDTPRYPLGPTVLPGSYKVRLTVDGKASSATLTVKMDPRVKTPAAGLQKKFATETRLAAIVSDSSLALIQANSIRQQLDAAAKSASAQTKDAIDAFEKKLSAVVGSGGGFFAPPSDQVTLTRVNGEASTLYQQVWQADAEPTSSQMSVLSSTESGAKSALARWKDLQSTDLPALNQSLRGASLPEIQPEKDAHAEESQVDEE